MKPHVDFFCFFFSENQGHLDCFRDLLTFTNEKARIIFYLFKIRESLELGIRVVKACGEPELNSFTKIKLQ